MGQLWCWGPAPFCIAAAIPVAATATPVPPRRRVVTPPPRVVLDVRFAPLVEETLDAAEGPGCLIESIVLRRAYLRGAYTHQPRAQVLPVFRNRTKREREERDDEVVNGDAARSVGKMFRSADV